MQLSQKKKPFLNFSSIMKTLKVKTTLIHNVFSNLRTSKNVVREMPKKSRFRGPFDK